MKRKRRKQEKTKKQNVENNAGFVGWSAMECGMRACLHHRVHLSCAFNDEKNKLKYHLALGVASPAKQIFFFS